MWQRVDVQIVPKVDPAAIGPVENADATDGILLNHAYVDMRGFSIAEAQEVVAEEAELLREIEAIGADDERLEELKDGLYEAASELSGFDVELLERSSRFPPLAPHQYRVAMADCLVMSRMHRRSHIFFFRSRGTSWGTHGLSRHAQRTGGCRRAAHSLSMGKCKYMYGFGGTSGALTMSGIGRGRKQSRRDAGIAVIEAPYVVSA